MYRSRWFFVWLPAVVAVLVVFSRSAPALDVYTLDSGLTPAEVQNQPYSFYVRQCVDKLVQYGADRYGDHHTPILMSIIDVRNNTSPSNPLALDEGYRVVRRGRRNPAGSNLWMDQDTIRVMHKLSRQTGQAGYAECANNYISHYTTNIRNKHNLIHWGWHEYYNAYTDRKAWDYGDHHELHQWYGDWDSLWAVNSAAVMDEANLTWQWHVVNKTTGETNRHDNGEHGIAFCFAAGAALDLFDFVYQKTGNQTWRDRARLLADYYWQNRNPTTNLVAMTPNLGTTRFDGCHFDTTVAGLYCGCLLSAYQRTNDTLFRDQAVAYLKAYAQYGYDGATGKWWGCLKLDGTPVSGPPLSIDPNNYDSLKPVGYIDPWQPYACGCSRGLDTAITYAKAAALTGDGMLLQAAERWADFISDSLPAGPCATDTWYAEYAKDWGIHGTYADYYGKTIEFFVSMAQLTGDDKYVDLAHKVANEAVSKLYYNGLFRGHPCSPYYEATNGVGVLLKALMQLDELDQVPEPCCAVDDRLDRSALLRVEEAEITTFVVVAVQLPPQQDLGCMISDLTGAFPASSRRHFVTTLGAPAIFESTRTCAKAPRRKEADFSSSFCLRALA